MTLFALSGLLNSLSVVIFGFLVFFKEPKNRTFQFWLIFSLIVGLWEFGVYKIGVTTVDPQLSLFWWRIAYIGVILIPPTFIHFVYAWLEVKKGIFFYFSWVVSLFYSIINLWDLFFGTTLFIPGVRWIFNSFYYNVPQPLYTVFVVLWFFMVLYAHYKLWKIYKISSGAKRSQVKYFLVAFIIGFAGGSTCYLVVYNINFYPYFNFTAPLYPIIMSYAILRYRLMNIKMLITEILAVYMTIIFIVSIFTPKSIILEIFLILGFIGMVVTLIHSASSEARVRDDLKDLNDHLQEKVDEQTHEIKQAYEVEKKARVELEELDKAKDQFILTTQHHLRTPLTIIKGYLGVIEEDPSISDSSKTAVEKIHHSTETLAKFINDLLEVTELKVREKERKDNV